jgi:DNA-binding NarL/FixJ family response regulator
VRGRLLRALGRDPGIEIQRCVDDPFQALELDADVAVLGMPTEPSWLPCLSPQMSGPRVVAVIVDAPEQPRRRWPRRRRDRDSADLVLDALTAGVAGILALDGASDAELREAVMTVHRGGAAITPRFAALLLAEFSRPGRRGRSYGPSPLDEREREILLLLLQGRTPEEIARELKIGLSALREQMIPRVLRRAGFRSYWQEPWRPDQRLPGAP